MMKRKSCLLLDKLVADFHLLIGKLCKEGQGCVHA